MQRFIIFAIATLLTLFAVGIHATSDELNSSGGNKDGAAGGRSVAATADNAAGTSTDPKDQSIGKKEEEGKGTTVDGSGEGNPGVTEKSQEQPTNPKGTERFPGLDGFFNPPEVIDPLDVLV